MKKILGPNVYKVIAIVTLTLLIHGLSSAIASNKIVLEVKSVVDAVKESGNSVSNSLEDFNKEFVAPANNLTAIEANIEELTRQGYLTKNYKDNPEMWDYINSLSAKNVVAIKDILLKYIDVLQSDVGAFHKAVYKGKDQLEDLRSDDMGSAGAELHFIKTEFAELENRGLELSKDCRGNKGQISPRCVRERRAYNLSMNHLEKKLRRLIYVKQIAGIKGNIIAKLDMILEGYTYKEQEITDTISDYLFKLEQYGNFVSNDNLGGLLAVVSDLKKLDKSLSHFKSYQVGLGHLVIQAGDALDKAADRTLNEDIDVESRTDLLKSKTGKEQEIRNLIKTLERKAG